MFKIGTTMHNIFHQRSPSYVKDLVTFCVNDSQRRQLRSSSTRSAVVCRTRTQFGRRSFSVCGSDVWNSLITCYHHHYQHYHCHNHHRFISNRICFVSDLLHNGRRTLRSLRSPYCIFFCLLHCIYYCVVLYQA